MKKVEDPTPTTPAIKTKRPVPELTHDEARLLSYYKELLDGFIPLDWFISLAQERLSLNEPNTVLGKLLDKEVLHCDSFADDDRQEFNLLPQGYDSDLTLFVGVRYDATIEKYVRSRKLSLVQSKSDPAR